MDVDRPRDRHRFLELSNSMTTLFVIAACGAALYLYLNPKR